MHCQGTPAHIDSLYTYDVKQSTYADSLKYFTKLAIVMNDLVQNEGNETMKDLAYNRGENQKNPLLSIQCWAHSLAMRVGTLCWSHSWVQLRGVWENAVKLLDTQPKGLTAYVDGDSV